MPATQKNDTAIDAPLKQQGGRSARPRAVVDGVRGAAVRLAHAPRDLAQAQYELARHAVVSTVVVDVDVKVDVDVASRQASPEG